MAADIHLTLARVTALPAGESVDTQNALRVTGFSDEALMFSQLEFEMFFSSDRDAPDRNYDLFSWLAGIRGELKPLVEVEKLKEVTRGFLSWCDNQSYKLQEKEMRKNDNGSPGYWFGYQPNRFWDDYISGDHSFVLYPLRLLADFDYDQQVQIVGPDPYGSIADHLETQAQYANTTYRQAFGHQWFKFLDRAVADKWDLAIFSFDS